MKYLKITIITFIFTMFFTSILATQAKIVGIADLEVPVLSGIANTGNVTKENFSNQKFDLVTCNEDITGKETAVKLRTYSVNYGGYSSWKVQTKGKTTEISPGVHDVPATYKLNAKAVEEDHILPSKLYGTWILD